MIRFYNFPLHTVGIVVRNGGISEVLPSGRHTVIGFASVTTYRAYGKFHPPPNIPMEVALLHPAVAVLLDVTRVPEGSLAVVMRDGVFEDAYGPGILAYFRGPIKYTVEVFELMGGVIAPARLAELATRHAALRAYVRELAVPVGRTGLLVVNGVLHSALTTGNISVLNNGNSYELKLAPVGIEGMEVSGQEILTSDKANVRVNYYFRYRVSNPRKALLEVMDYMRELRLSAALALREYIGALTLDELLTSKLTINEAVAAALSTSGESLGAEYVDGGIRDVILPGEMRAIVNRVLIAEKNAEANVITRRDEAAATRSLLNSAKLMDEHPMLRRLKEMEYVERVAERIDRITVAGNNDVMGGLRELLVPKE